MNVWRRGEAMTESRDHRLAELYRQASRETPPAQLDHAVMDLARKSVGRRLWTPFGGGRLAGAATVAVVVLSVLVILTVPPAEHRHVPGVDLRAPGSDSQEIRRKAQPAAGTAATQAPAQGRAQPEAPTAPAASREFSNAMPEAVRALEKAENGARTRQAPVPREEADDLVSPGPAAGYYLWAGTFRERAQAQRMKAIIDGLGMDCDIETLRVDATGILYRVRVGPYRDLSGLEIARDRLAASGIAATIGLPPE
jgi:cell division septation protein DedD